jgi:hypothetical protein
VHRERLPELELALTGKGMHGVYETGVPPEFNAALQIGCVATLALSARGRNLGAGFDLAELQMRPVVQYEYFSQRSTLRHMLLHHSADAGRGRGVVALHIPADDLCHVWVVNPARAGQREVTGPAAERAWAEVGTSVCE